MKMKEKNEKQTVELQGLPTVQVFGGLVVGLQ